MTKRFEVAIDITKQIISLCAALIAISVAFLGRIALNTEYTLYVISLSWALWMGAIIIGILAMGYFSSKIEKEELHQSGDSIHNTLGARLIKIQQLLFVVGIVVFILAALVDRS